ncbi:molybdopterin cofactor-binding domain-containing protein [Pelagicoccus sp. SDUM812003]|uniref:xanthine dehydrogenase family protein molybdopterin-binding subunit n=1 Tax=Pelagicoccus sp. SDUM812003 TaxID=3041267 RepID=UPI00280E0D30|nr:molybdopterin cofactor-binding domain-containing protein [Pelagicoccus sp. SDUM812003]MDQ8204671.1 molybdopterin-dependent oxidoreductase [Pelagicoccus sp. SDUM812003]
MDLSEIDPITFPPNETSAPALDRRSFLKRVSLAGGGIALALMVPKVTFASAFVGSKDAASGADFSPNLFVSISPEGKIEIIASNPECGQGTKTSLPMIIAEELDVAWEQVTVTQGDLNEDYGRQVAGGSRATPTHYEPYRILGASARVMLVRAAAERWNVPYEELDTDGRGQVRHSKSGKVATYGDLAMEASNVAVPDPSQLRLKEPQAFNILGKRISGVDNRALVTGKPLFGIDVRRPQQKVACFVRCPVFNGTLRSAKLDKARSAAGVLKVFEISVKGVASGVVVVAETTWQAMKARELLELDWDEGRTSQESDQTFYRYAEEAWQKGDGGEVLRNDGNFESAFTQKDAIGIEARYQYPFISHANLEPQNTVALFDKGRVEIWSPSQAPERGRNDVARVLEIDPEAVTVHLTRIGGGFGRRLRNDFMVEAAVIAREMPGIPIQLLWTREDDMQHDWYRPAGYHSFRGAVDPQGKLVAWSDHFVTFSDGYETSQVSGVARLRTDEFPSQLVPNCLIRQEPMQHGIPLGPYRAPRANAQCFAQQSFMDELAHAAGRDPVAFRLDLLGDARILPAENPRSPDFDTGRMAGVVRLAAEKSNWGATLPKGKGRGIAFRFSHLGYAAIVAQVDVSKEGKLTVERVVVAVDVGRQIVNRSGAENQAEGCVCDALSSTLMQEITIEGGRVEQSGFEDMPLLRIDQAPMKIETHFLITDNPPTGLGEPVFPPVPPALTNAIFAATGKRIRRLPLSKEDLSWG